MPQAVRFLACALPLLLACSSEEPAGFDAGTLAPDASPMPTCDLGPVPEQLRTTEGGKVSFDLSSPEPSITFTAVVPPGWRSSIENDPPRFTARVPYEIQGELTISIHGACADASGEKNVRVQVDKLSWTAITPWSEGVTGPLAREHAVMWLDDSDPDRLFMFGGMLYQPQQFTVTWDLWTLDLGTNEWSEIPSTNAAPDLAGGRLATAPNERSALYLNGSDQQNNMPFSLVRLSYSETEGTWSDVAVQSAPTSGSILSSFVYDAPRNRYVSACGFGARGIHCDVAAYYPDTDRWETLAPEPDNGERPSGRYGFFYAYDSSTERMIIFSGAQRGTAPNPVNPAHDTWALELGEDPVRWVKLIGEDDPIGRRNGCFAFDPVGHRLFVWGGTADGRTTHQGLFALDLDRGFEAWQEVPTENAPPIRSSGSSLYDPARHRILFGFGNGAAIYPDLHALNL